MGTVIEFCKLDEDDRLSTVELTRKHLRSVLENLSEAGEGDAFSNANWTA